VHKIKRFFQLFLIAGAASFLLLQQEQKCQSRWISQHQNRKLTVTTFREMSTSHGSPFPLTHRSHTSPMFWSKVWLELWKWLRLNEQRWARIRTGSDWIRTEANFGRSRSGSDCNFFQNWWIRTGSDWVNFCCFNVIILKISKVLVVIRYYRFAKW